MSTVASGLHDACQYCGMHHTGICSLVSAIEYHPNGMVKRVEFHRPMQILPVKATELSFTTGDTGEPL